jgi:hypothetical protein
VALSIAWLASWPSRFRPQAVFPQDASKRAERQTKARENFGIDIPCVETGNGMKMLPSSPKSIAAAGTRHFIQRGREKACVTAMSREILSGGCYKNNEASVLRYASCS